MKTEKPTPRRLLKESEKGSSYRSRDLTVGLILFVGVIVLAQATSLASVRALYEVVVHRDFQVQPSEIAWLATKAFAWSVLPITLAAIVCMALSSLAQSKGVIATGALKIDFNRLDPVNGFKNLFGMKMVKNLLAALLYSIIAFGFVIVAWFVWGDGILAQARVSVATSAYASHAMAMRVVLGLLAALVPLILLAALLEHILYIRDLRMDKSEIKQEHKESEGNPEIKQRRREQAQELSAQTQADVAGSSMVLANPTHIAVGIFAQEAGGVTWPFVSVHEKGERALKVIALAEKLGVPVVRDVPLARAIYSSTKRYRFVQSAQVDAVLRLLQWLRDVERAGAPEEPDTDMDAEPGADGHPRRMEET